MSDMDQDSFPDTQIQEEVIKAPSPLSSEVDDQARRYTQRQSIYTPLTPSLTDREWRTPKRSLITSLHTTWAYESICLVVSLGAVGSIISILASFNSRPLPEWPYSLTLNTVIALLAALANVSLAVPVSNGISQLKWNHFKRGNARLGDLELFDEASRGPWGGWKLLFLIRNRPLASFGAIAMIAASSIGPFSQQVATYPIRTVATNQSAILPVAVNYTGFYSGPSSSGYHPLLPMKSAVYNGLFSESNPLAPLSATCETGNCTWPVINSLAVCSTCVDMTPLMVRYCQDGTTPINGDVSKCGWQIPQGARLNDSTEVFSITSELPSIYGDMPYSSIMRLYFLGTEAQNGTPGNYNPWATQCTLEYCAQTIETAVNFGNFSQNITGITTNDTIINVSNTTEDIPVIITAPDNTTLWISEAASLGITTWFTQLFVKGSASRTNQTTTASKLKSRSILLNTTIGISSGTINFDSDIVETFYIDYYGSPDGLQQGVSNLATSMTLAFRTYSGANPVYGITYGTETYVHVRWIWILFPVLVLLSSALFLVIVMVSSRRQNMQLWKASALAIFFYGVGFDFETKRLFEKAADLNDKIEIAQRLIVDFEEDSDHASLLTH